MTRNGFAGVGLLDRLITLQEAHGWSDREFAKNLGVSNGLWSATRNRRKPLGRKALRGVLRAYPELEAHVKAYWEQELQPDPHDVSTRPSQVQTGQHRPSGTDIEGRG